MCEKRVRLVNEITGKQSNFKGTESADEMQGKDVNNRNTQDSSPHTEPPPYSENPTKLEPSNPGPQLAPLKPEYPQLPPPEPEYPTELAPQNPEKSNPAEPVNIPHPQNIQVNLKVPKSGRICIQSLVGPEPCRITCQFCNSDMVTRVERRPTIKTHLRAFLFFVCGLWPCICVPYCMSSCLDADHYCTKCDAFAGSCSRIC